MNSTVKTAVFWVVILFTVILLWNVVQSGAGPDTTEYNYSEFRTEVLSDNVEWVTVKEDVKVEGQLKSGQNFTVVLPSDLGLAQ